MWSPVLTVTTSPGSNGLAGRKLPPSWSESDSSRPAWTPVREPVTTSLRTWRIGRPRNAICVCGEATRSPGTGNTLTIGGAVRVIWADPQPATPRPTRAATNAIALLDLIHRRAPERMRRADDWAEQLRDVGGGLAIGQKESSAAAEYEAAGGISGRVPARRASEQPLRVVRQSHALGL